jgi:hypothetical protein
MLFDIQTPLGIMVHCTKSYWKFIVNEKHPALVGHEKMIQTVLADPDEIRQSKRDPQIFLFYKGAKPRWLCAVAKLEDESGFLVTAYPTDAIKAGEMIWKK